MKTSLKIGSTIAVVACLTLAGCSATETAEQNAATGDNGGDQVLTVSIFGGSWGSAINEHVIKPFEQETGIKVRSVESTSTVALGKMRQDPNAFDVALLDSGVSELSRAEGLVATMPEGKLSHLDELADEARVSDDDGLWAVTMGFSALGIAYNTEKVTDPPTAWADLWDPKYAGKVTVPTPETTGGLPLLIQAAKLAGGGINDIEPGFKKMSELDVVAFFNSSGNASNLLQSGEATVAAHYNPGAWPLADQGLPIEWIAPEEGALGQASNWHVSSTTDKADLALQFIDFASSAKAQEGLAQDLYVAPANKNVEVTGEASARMPYGEGGSLSDLKFSDWNVINEHRSEWQGFLRIADP